MKNIPNVDAPSLLHSGLATLSFALAMAVAASSAREAEAAPPRADYAEQPMSSCLQATAEARNTRSTILNRTATKDAVDAARALCDQIRQSSCERLASAARDAATEVERHKFTSTPGSRTEPGVVVLLDDARFTKAFLKPYEQMSREEFAAYGDAIRTVCSVGTGAFRALDGRARAWIIEVARGNHQPLVEKIRATRTRLGQLAADAALLTADGAGLAQLDELRKAAASLRETRLPEPWDAYEAAMADAERRVAIPVESERTRLAIASASGREGLAALIDMGKQVRSIPISQELALARQAQSAQLRDKESQLSGELAAQERQRIAALGDGFAALELGAKWYQEFNRNYEALLPQAPELAKLRQEFLEQRQTILVGALPDITERIRAAHSDKELDALSARYLLEADSRGAAGMRIQQSVAAQRADNEKRAVLGKDYDPGTRTPATATEQVASAAQRVDGEPSTGDLYDAIVGKFRAVAATAGAMSGGCDSMRDAGDAMGCILGKLIKQSGATTPMRVTHFEKIGCARAVGKAGFNCDYILSISGGVMNMLPSSLVKLSQGEHVVTQRFIHSESRGWIARGEEE